MLMATGVTKSYGSERVLDGVTLAAEEGEIVALLGPNGVGKTRLLSIIAGLRTADGGSVSIGGRNLATERSAAIAQLAIAPQDTGVQLMLTTRQNLEFYGRLAGLSRRQVVDEIERVATEVDPLSKADDIIDNTDFAAPRMVHG